MSKQLHIFAAAAAALPLLQLMLVDSTALYMFQFCYMLHACASEQAATWRLVQVWHVRLVSLPAPIWHSFDNQIIAMIGSRQHTVAM